MNHGVLEATSNASHLPVRKRMRIWPGLLIVAVALAASAQPPADEPSIKLGDSPTQVLKQLGQPRGRMRSGESEVWNYERGEVVFQNNAVESSYLLDDDQVVVKRARERAAAAAHAAAAEERAAREAALQAQQDAAAAAAAAAARPTTNAPAAGTNNTGTAVKDSTGGGATAGAVP